MIWHKETTIPKIDLLVLPGGFSYGDRLRCGAIAANSPIMRAVTKFYDNGGFIIGICNGFQILTEAKILPGALIPNVNQKFICKNVYLKPVSKTAAFTKSVDHNKSYKIPIAHGEGRYFADENTIKNLMENDQILFQYCDEQGLVSDKLNPNGSVHNIAGVTNAEKNVMGMMPHPERAVDALLGNQDGVTLFESLLNLAKV